VLFALVMITLMTPVVVTFVPLFVLISKIGMVNTYPALFLPFLTTPMGVFLMRQFMLGIPNELIEAAKLDGVSEFGIFARVVMPLCGPPLATLGILTFLTSWNNFLWPLVAAQSEDKYTLPVALSLFSTGQEATDYGLLLAGSVLVIGPIVLVFICLQRFFIQSVASTGIK
jgi:multiple sugar transport system permease protein